MPGEFDQASSLFPLVMKFSVFFELQSFPVDSWQMTGVGFASEQGVIGVAQMMLSHAIWLSRQEAARRAAEHLTPLAFFYRGVVIFDVQHVSEGIAVSTLSAEGGGEAICIPGMGFSYSAAG